MLSKCLCGGVTWDIEGPFDFISHCHCSRCRKAHGVAFATHIAAAAASFRIAGEDNVVTWQAQGGISRAFCRHCGAVVPSGEWQGLVFVPAGNLVDNPENVPGAVHIMVGSKAPWHTISDDLPRFDAYPPGIDAAVLPDLEPLDPPGRPRGSCLCQSVAFILESEPVRSHNCHCDRCRKARSAAHATNLFTAIDGVRFTRGQDQVVSYKLPEAQFFTQSFCRTCGSKMPRLDRERGIAVVPMGCFDDDPGIRAQSHIFVASKAPWFAITDDLPQNAERPS